MRAFGAAALVAVALGATDPQPARADTFTAVSGGLSARVEVTPNAALALNMLALHLRRGARAVERARVRLAFTMTTMQMAPAVFPLAERAPGVYVYEGAALSMRGDWRLVFTVAEAGRRTAFSVVDRVRG